MPIKCRTNLLSSHMTLQRHQPSIPLLTQDTFTADTLPDHVDTTASTSLNGSRPTSVVPECRRPNRPNTVTPGVLIQRLQPRGWARIFSASHPDPPGRVVH